MYDKFYFEEGWIFSPFIELKFRNMHFHNDLLILVFLCDMSGHVNLVGHNTLLNNYFSFQFNINRKSNPELIKYSK